MLRSILAWLDPRYQRGARWVHYHLAATLLLLAGNIMGITGTLTVQHIVANDGFVPGAQAPVIRISGAAAPATKDLRRYVVRIHNQGSSNSCVGQTGATIVEIESSERGYPVSSSSGFIWNQLNGGVNQGITYQAAFVLLQNEGDAPLSVVSLDGANYYGGYSPTAGARRAAYPYHANAGWHSVAVTDRGTIEAEISAGHPLAFAAAWSWNWVNHWDNPAALPYPDGSFAFWHSTTLVGYTPGGVILLNSWSSSWGSAGYVLVPWDVLARSGGEIAVFTIALPAKPKAKPFPAKAFEEWRTSHHEKPVPYQDKHKHLTWPAGIWLKHQSLRGIKDAGHWYKGSPGYDKYSFRRGVVYAWPKTHRYKVVHA